ncbi:Cna B-type domain-containing protein, partial [Periweissella fabaria]
MYKKMSALIGLLTILSTLIATPIAVFADSSSNHKDWGDSFITSGKLTDSSGADQDKFQIHQNMRAQWTYAIPEGTTDLHTGDTMVVNLPSQLKLQTVIKFNLDDGHGNTVATGQADPLTKKITFTFTDYAQEHANAGIDGRFFLDVQWDVQTIRTSTTTVTPVDLDWGTKATATKTTIDAVTGPNANEVLVKVGNFDPQDPSKINWVVRLNYAQKDLQNLKYTDAIGPNQALINDSISIGTVPHKDPSADGNEFGNFEPLTSAQTNITDPQHFSISIPATNKTVLVYYSTKITDDGFAGAYGNSGTLSATDNQTGVVINEVTNATASNKAGGDAETTTSIRGTKIWDDQDNGYGTRPSQVTINLLQDGVKIASKVISAETNWRYNFGKLDIYKPDSTKHVYMVQEDMVPVGYVASGGDANSNYNLTNTLQTMNIPVTKIWDDADNQDGIRPNEVTFALYADGQDTQKQVTLTADNATNNNTWTKNDAFAGLPIETATGAKIVYTVKEVGIAAKYTSNDGTAQNNYTITNSYSPILMHVTVNKQWNDQDNKDGKRPQQIQVQLYNGNQVIGEPIILSASTGWQGEWNNLPMYAAGQKIIYSAKEVGVTGYDEVDSPIDINNHITITNNLPVNPITPVDPQDPVIDPTTPVDPKEPTDPTKPVDPKEPTDPTKPVDPKEPTDPTKPVDPKEPTDPTKPVDPKEPTDP